MMSNILIIASSPRKNGNSNALANAFMQGASAANNSVEMITLYDKKINFCQGCFACQKTGECIIKDDALQIVNKMKNADVLVFATPIYYYEMSGQMKTMLDRANPLYDSDYKFRQVYLVACAADEDPKSIERAYNGLGGWVECFEKAKLIDYVFAGGVNDINDIKDHPALKKAYELGNSIK